MSTETMFALPPTNVSSTVLTAILPGIKLTYKAPYLNSMTADAFLIYRK